MLLKPDFGSPNKAPEIPDFGISVIFYGNIAVLQLECKMSRIKLAHNL